ncbi:hypothetical protein LINGRAHAP2_LOCUS6054 [Linum grandiflorum]
MEVLVDDTSLHQPGEWSLLWSLEIPPRMRHFLWRVARDVLPTPPDKDLDVVAVMWGLWKERNERVWQHTSRPEEMVVKQGRDAVKEWCQRDAGRSLAVATQPSMVCKKWHRPPVGVLKLNVDAAFFANEVSFGVGLALRGRAGQLMGYRHKRFNGLPAVKEGEARAVLEGLQWAEELGYEQLIIETDCLEVQRAMATAVADVTEFGRLIAECKRRLNLKPGISVLFGRRDGNGVAHMVARRAITSTVTVIGEVPPAWLSADMANICFSDSHN